MAIPIIAAPIKDLPRFSDDMLHFAQAGGSIYGSDTAPEEADSAFGGNSDEDVLDKCFTCDAVETYANLAEGYIAELGAAMHEPILLLFASLAALWVVVTGFKFFFAMIGPMHVARDLFTIIIAFSLLSSQGELLIVNIYDAALTLMGNSATLAFSIGQDSNIEVEGVRALMEATEKGVGRIFLVAIEVLKSTSFRNLTAPLYAIALVLPYFLVVLGFFSKIVVSIFRLMMIGIFAPFLIMFFAYGWGRPMAIAGAKTMLSAIFVLFAASVSVGLLFYGVDVITKELSNDDLENFSILNSDYLTIMMLGWCGAALMTEGIGIANSITGSLLSNTAAGIITAGVTASAGLAGAGAANSAKLGGLTAAREFVTAGQEGGTFGTDTARRIKSRVNAVMNFDVGEGSGVTKPKGGSDA